MKIFWPQRSDAKGFSIENLARKYREKLSSVSTNKVSNQHLGNSHLKSLNEDSKYISISRLSNNRVHWANRDFSEYREAS